MERSTAADQIKFLDYARSSCGEFRTQVIVGARVGFLQQPQAEQWVQDSKEIAAMIQGLIRSIRNRPH
jgi:four helix bundle protein